jgi:hydroxymethylbilane synthase
VVSRKLRIASRGSQLALWQAETVRDQLIAAHGALDVEIRVIRTTGDRILDVPLARIGDRGLFTKEIDEAVLDGRADLAVHSLKDVPTTIPSGLTIAAISRREDPRDVLIGRQRDETLASLPGASRVGTSSLRRRAQLARLRPDLQVVDLRGNLNTRLEKLDAGEYDAIILAAAGVVRLGWSLRIGEFFQPTRWLPAVGQGALAIVTREDHVSVNRELATLHDPSTASCVLAERAFLRSLEGGCQVPIGALAILDGEALSLDGFVSDLAGATILRERRSGSAADPAALGSALADELIGRGANDVLQAVRTESMPPGIEGP